MKSNPKKKEKKTMADKPAEINKSKEIRKIAEELKKNGEKVRPITIINLLKSRSIAVSSPMVSIVLSKMGLKKKKKNKKSKAQSAPAASVAKAPAASTKSNSKLNIDDLMKAKKMVQDFGGAKKLVDAIAALVELT